MVKLNKKDKAILIKRKAEIIKMLSDICFAKVPATNFLLERIKYSSSDKLVFNEPVAGSNPYEIYILSKKDERILICFTNLLFRIKIE